MKDILLGMARTFAEGREYDKALEVLNAAIAQHPDFAEAYLERGKIKYHLHDKLGATADLRRALELNPTLIADGSYGAKQY